jgi:hypothetical protein
VGFIPNDVNSVTSEGGAFADIRVVAGGDALGFLPCLDSAGIGSLCEVDVISGLEVNNEEEPKLRLATGVAFDDEATACFLFLFNVLSFSTSPFTPFVVFTTET